MDYDTLEGFSDEELARQPHAALLMARALAPQSRQAQLAPFEHRAFAREYVEDNPALGPAAMGMNTIAYAVAKALGLMKGRTDTSMDQIGAGYQGIHEGAQNRRYNRVPQKPGTPWPEG